MKIQTPLYYRYLMKQTLIMCFVSVAIALTICLLFFLTNITEYLYSVIIGSLIWIFPLYVFIIFFIWMFKYLKSKSQIKDINLFNRILNKEIRSRVLKSGKRIKYIIPSKDQEKNFFEIIKPEIEKQKQLLAILEGRY